MLLNRDYVSALISSGFVFYGALSGGLASLWLIKQIHKIDAAEYIKVIVPAIPLAHGPGRVGCHLAGCCYGTPYSGIFSIVYVDNAIAPCDVHLFPVQLLEAGVNFIIAGVLFVIVNKNKSHFYLCISISPFTAFAVSS